MGTKLMIPENELQRIEALRRYQILDTPADGAFDRIAALAAQLLEVPIAMVSLVDTERIWFKSHHGVDISEVAREPGLCASAILGDGPYILSDASIDPRSLANSLVAGVLGLRFYAAVPLITHDHYHLGTLCCIDLVPRTISQKQIEALECLAKVVMDQMELRLAARQIYDLHKELRKANDTLRIKASHDALTGLWSRSAIMQHLKKFLAVSRREKRPLAVLAFDIDFFKSINDRYGHPAGDQVLVEVTRRLQENCRQSESIGRIGGEEFLGVMYPCDMEQAQLAAERFRIAVAGTDIDIDIGENERASVHVTISIGLCSIGGRTDIGHSEMVKFADDALYSSKNNGRNCVTVARLT